MSLIQSAEIVNLRRLQNEQFHKFGWSILEQRNQNLIVCGLNLNGLEHILWLLLTPEFLTMEMGCRVAMLTTKTSPLQREFSCQFSTSTLGHPNTFWPAKTSKGSESDTPLGIMLYLYVLCSNMWNFCELLKHLDLGKTECRILRQKPNKHWQLFSSSKWLFKSILSSAD